MVRNSLAITLSLCLFVVAAASTGEAFQKAAAAAPNAVTPATGDTVVAKVYGDTITEKQVLNAIKQMAQRRPMTQQQMQQKDVLLYKEAVDTLVGMALLKNEAKTENLTADKTKVDGAYQGIVKGFSSEADFKKALDAQGLTEATLRTAVEDNMLNQQVLDHVTKDLPPVGDAEVQKFYEGNPQFFQRPEQVHAAHILLRPATDATPEQKAEVRKKLEGIRADVESKKITFADAAEKYSEDKTNATKGGDLGFFGRGQMVKQFEDAAFSTKPGEMSPVVESQFGFHLINVFEIKPAGKIGLDEARKNIQDYLGNQAKQAAIQKYIDGLRAKTTVEILINEEQWKQRHSAN